MARRRQIRQCSVRSSGQAAPYSAAARPLPLRIEPRQQLSVSLHLGVAVGVEQAAVVRCKDVRDTVLVQNELALHAQQRVDVSVRLGIR